jgi:hypothetical protein
MNTPTREAQLLLAMKAAADWQVTAGWETAAAAAAEAEAHISGGQSMHTDAAEW